MAGHVTGFTPPGSDSQSASLNVTSTSDSSAPGPLVRVGGAPAVAQSDVVSVRSFGTTDSTPESQATAYNAIRSVSRTRRSASAKPPTRRRQQPPPRPIERAEDAGMVVLGARGGDTWEVAAPLPHANVEWTGPPTAEETMEVDLDGTTMEVDLDGRNPTK